MVLAEFVRAIKGSAPTSFAHQHFNLLMAMVEFVILLMLTHYSIFGLLCSSPLMTLVKFVEIRRPLGSACEESWFLWYIGFYCIFG